MATPPARREFGVTTSEPSGANQAWIAPSRHTEPDRAGVGEGLRTGHRPSVADAFLPPRIGAWIDSVLVHGDSDGCLAV